MFMKSLGAIVVALSAVSWGYGQSGPAPCGTELGCRGADCPTYDCSDACCDSRCGRAGCRGGCQGSGLSRLGCNFFRQSCDDCQGGCDNGCAGDGCARGCCGRAGGGCCDSAGVTGRARRALSCDGCATGACDERCAGVVDPCCHRYFRTFIGWNQLQDFTTQNNATVPAGPINATTNDGWIFGFAFGRYFQPCRRFEFEFSYRNNTGDLWSNGPIVTPFDGQVNSYSFMANLIFDLERFQFGRVTPYIGGGIGPSIIDGDFVVNGNPYSIDETAFAGQLIMGGKRPVNQRADVFAEYRYLATSKIGGEFVALPQLDNFRYQAHSFALGLQIRR